MLVPTDAQGDDDEPDYKVRVRLSFVPEQNAQRHDQLRAWIRSQPLDAPYAELLIGGYEQAIFKPSDQFAGLGLTFRGTDTAERTIDPHGFELLLDCSIEVYTLLTGMLTADRREVRLGEVVLRIRPDGASTVVEPRSIDVWLRLDRPAGHPLAIEPAQTGATTITVRNPSAVEVRAEAHPTMLVVDTMTGEVVRTIAVQPLPLVVAPNGTAPVALTPASPTEQATSWNKVALSLWNLRLDLNSQLVLSQTHQLASRSNMRSKVRLSSYLLEHPDDLRRNFPDVYGIQVQLRRGTNPPITASLTIAQPSTTVDVDFSLIDLLQGMRPELPTFEYHRRNMLNSRVGDWSEWETITGRELQIVPV